MAAPELKFPFARELQEQHDALRAAVRWFRAEAEQVERVGVDRQARVAVQDGRKVFPVAGPRPRGPEHVPREEAPAIVALGVVREMDRGGKFVARAGVQAPVRIGSVTGSGRVVVKSAAETLIDAGVDELRSAWKKPLAWE